MSKDGVITPSFFTAAKKDCRDADSPLKINARMPSSTASVSSLR